MKIIDMLGLNDHETRSQILFFFGEIPPAAYRFLTAAGCILLVILCNQGNDPASGSNAWSSSISLVLDIWVPVESIRLVWRYARYEATAKFLTRAAASATVALFFMVL